MAQYLDLVALGTYADVASLDYDDRACWSMPGSSAYGKISVVPGISALLDIAGRDPASLKAQDLGFVIRST